MMKVKTDKDPSVLAVEVRPLNRRKCEVFYREQRELSLIVKGLL